jgi:D-tyrosyl-tRNA(Tyr) deacylase
MRVVIQRVQKADVTINGQEKRAIGQGLVVLLGIESADDKTDVEWLVNKVVNLRIFNDAAGVMNLSLLDIKGALMVVSQFTLMAATKKGNRPSYIRAANHEHAVPLYNYFLSLAQQQMDSKLISGTFAADMQVALINDGPVTIQIDSKNKD